MRSLRGSRIAMTFQDPLSALHPYYKVGWQIAEAYRAHNDVSARAARAHAVDLLRRVGIPDPLEPGRRLPTSILGRDAPAGDDRAGSVLQSRPADRRRADDGARRDRPGADPRPDRRAQAEYGSAVIVITHDLGVVAEVADDILVMYAGRVDGAGQRRRRVRGAAAPVHLGPAELGHPHRPQRRDRLRPIPGSPPSLIRVPPGCPFHERCAYAHLTHGQAGREVPPLREVARGGHFVRVPSHRRRARTRSSRAEIAPTYE